MTAETALALPVLVVVLSAALWVLAAVSAQLRCVDAAAAAARAAARGDAPGGVAGAARRVAPPGADVRVRHVADEVHVEVSARVRSLPVLTRLPSLPVSGRAVAVVEPGVR